WQRRPFSACAPGRITGARALTSELVDVDRLGALRTALLLVGHLRPLGKRAVTVAADAGEVDEQIAPAVIGRDEAEALVVAEPLYGSRCHLLPLCCDSGTSGCGPEGPDRRETYQDGQAQGCAVVSS